MTTRCTSARLFREGRFKRSRRLERDKTYALKSSVSSFPYNVSTERDSWGRDLRQIYFKKKSHALLRDPRMGVCLVALRHPARYRVSWNLYGLPWIHVKCEPMNKCENYSLEATRQTDKIMISRMFMFVSDYYWSLFWSMRQIARSKNIQVAIYIIHMYKKESIRN